MANTRQQSITIDSTKVTSDVTGMHLLVTRTELNNEIVDPAGINRAKVDGGDLRFYQNPNQTGRLNLEVITFEYDSATGAGDAQIQLRCSDPAWVVSSTVDTVIYVEYGDSALVQPSVAEAFGRNDTWQSKKIVHHLESLTAVDSTGNGNNGTSTGVLVAGKIGSGQDFNGVNQRIPLGTNAYILKSTPYHISAWIASDVSNNDVMLNFASDATAGWQVFTNSGGGYTQFTFGSSSADWINLRASGLILSTYTKLEIAFDGVDATNISSFKVYIDGQSVTVSTASAMGAVDQTNTIAAKNSALYYLGEIDEVMVGQLNPSPAFILTSFNNENSPSTFMTAGAPIAVGGGGISIAVDSTLPSLSSSLNLSKSDNLFSIDINSTLPSLISSLSLTNADNIFDLSVSSELPSLTSILNLSVVNPGNNTSINSFLPSLVSSLSLTKTDPAAGASISSELPSLISSLSLAVTNPEFDFSVTSTLPSLSSSLSLYNGVLGISVGDRNNINIVVKSTNINVITKSRNIEEY